MYVIIIVIDTVFLSDAVILNKLFHVKCCNNYIIYD